MNTVESKSRHRPHGAPWDRRRRAGSDTLVAAVDLGTNNCRLLIANPTASGFRVVDGFSRIVRLGEGVEASGVLSPDAMDRATDALRVCAAKLRRRGVTRARYVGTEACRRAANGEAFLDRVENETGLRLEIISSREEAELTLAGCLPLLDPAIPNALMFDVGGGSAEILWVRQQEDGPPSVLGWTSLPCGVINLTERHGTTEFTLDEYEDLVQEVAEMLKPFEEDCRIADAIAAGTMQMIGTAGTVTTIAGVHMGLKRYNRSVVDGCWLDFDAVDSVSRQLVGASFAERAAHACIGTGRAELVVAGCAVLEAVCRTWPVGRMRVADRGVREGILIALIDEVNGESRASRVQ